MGCLLLWIIVFPVYLFRRATLIHGPEQSSTSLIVSVIGAARLLIVVLGLAAPYLGWQRLSVDKLSQQVGKSIQKTLRENPATQEVKFKGATLVHRNGNEYTGVATADYSGQEVTYAVDVTY